MYNYKVTFVNEEGTRETVDVLAEDIQEAADIFEAEFGIVPSLVESK